MAEQILAHALSTIARVKDRLTITSANHDTEFERLINSVTDFIESQTNRRFLETTHTEIHSFGYAGPDMIFLKQFPVQSVTSVKWRQGLFDNPNYSLVPTTDWVLRNDGLEGIIKVERGWLYEGENVAQVVYLAGYKINFANAGDNSTHTLPADLTDLCERLVVRIFKRRENEGKDSTTSAQGSSVNYMDGFTDEDQLTLDKYRANPIIV